MPLRTINQCLNPGRVEWQLSLVCKFYFASFFCVSQHFCRTYTSSSSTIYNSKHHLLHSCMVPPCLCTFAGACCSWFLCLLILVIPLAFWPNFFSRTCLVITIHTLEALQCLKCLIYRKFIFRWDPAVSIADEIADEDDIDISIGDDIAPNFVDQSSAKAWDETWLEVEEEVDMEG